MREDSEWKANQVLRIIDKSLRQNQSSKSAVVRRILASPARFLSRYSGFEIAPDARKFWGKHATKRIMFSVGDYLQVQTAHSDMLLLLDVIEHIPNPFEFLSALRGRADNYVFHIPLDLSAMSVAREHPLLLVRQKVGHIHYFTKGLALSLIQESGFQVLDWFYTGASFTAPQVSWKAKLARLPRRLAYAIDRDWGVRLFGGDTLMILARAKQD